MLSPQVEKIIEQAMKAASIRRHEFATVEHLCFALFDDAKIKTLLSQIGVSKKDIKKRFLDYIDTQLEVLPKDAAIETLPSLGFQRVLQRAAMHIAGAGKSEVSAEHVLVAAFDEDESYAVFMMQQAGITRLDLVSLISHGSSTMEEEHEDHEDEDEDEAIEPLDEKPHKKSVLSRYTVCLTQEAKEGRLDQLVGRDAEIERAIQVLSRRRKNNPLFVGDPGVGKTALAEGLAARIVQKDVPDYLQDAQMYLLDMGALLAGARYRGDFESRLRSVLAALADIPNAIMVIDEIHTVIGAGATTGSSMDASNLLKPVLSKGQIRCIGSTTYKEYRTYFEKDRALARRFQKIDIEEPSESECLSILQGIRPRYEKFHNVTISDDALAAAVGLSKRFLHERRLPDKAIDLIDEACARMRLKNNGQAVKAGQLVVDEAGIEAALASMANLPSRQVSQNDKSQLLNLEGSLKSKIFGQDEAIEQLSSAILLARAGLRDREKPIGSYLFSGPSGVGKTEVVKELAAQLGVSLVRFDMSEYMERHAASRLVGAPPGYVGYEQGGLLTDAINKSPYAVLLLDEIEKAHPDVFNMLLQVMDYGKLTDTFGRACDFRHVIIVMTSNVGAREMEHRAIGFLEDNISKKNDQAVKKLFSPEFRNRLDACITFKKLSPVVMVKVVDKFIAELGLSLAEKNISVSISEAARAHLAHIGYDASMGARPLARIIQESIKKPLAREILFGKLADGGKVDIDMIDGKLNVQRRA